MPFLWLTGMRDCPLTVIRVVPQKFSAFVSWGDKGCFLLQRSGHGEPPVLLQENEKIWSNLLKDTAVDNTSIFRSRRMNNYEKEFENHGSGFVSSYGLWHDWLRFF
jgi:hypothetical protein